MKVYFCASGLDALKISHLQGRAASLGITVVSSWPNTIVLPEDFDEKPLEDVRAIAKRNDQDLSSAHVLIAFPRHGAGAEMFAEIRLALALGIPVIWCGSRKALSAYREGVFRAENPMAALKLLVRLAQLVRSAGGNDVLTRWAIWMGFEFANASAALMTPTAFVRSLHAA